MSTVCTFSECKRASRALCYVCHQSLCREHFDKHDHSFNSLLNSLNDKVKDFDDRLDDLNNEELIENCYEILDKWRDDCYKTIGRLYDKKCQEIKRRFHENIDRQQEKINQIHLKITQLLEEEDISQKNVNLVKLDVENLEEEMNQLEQTKYQIEVHPLKIDNNLIIIKEINTTHFNLKQISLPYKTIDCYNNSPKPLASNNQYLLIYRMQNLCLIDRELTLIKQTPWTYGRIWDMCWSSTLNRFIVMAHYEVYLVDENTMLIERIQTISRHNWWSCTCSNTSLFLSTYEQGSSIMEFSLQPSIQFIKKWTTPITCNKDEFIKDIIYNNQSIALTIYNKKYLTKRIELRSLPKFDYLWSFDLDIRGECYNTLRCSSLNDNQWLVADFHNQTLFHITNQGKLKTIYTYNTAPCYINLFTPNILVISTPNSVNFHKL
jgi:hypothetical protein